MEHRQHCGEWARSSGSHGPWTECRSPSGELDEAARTSPDQSCISSSTKMASTMARTDVAMKRWLSIVGAAKRDGHDAVSHRHGTYVDFIQHGLSEKFLQLDIEIATRHSADFWIRRSSAGYGTVPMMDGGP